MIDGLYLNKTWVAEVDVILNFQSNDLAKPDTLNVSYSLTFQLPDNLLIRDLLENAEQIDSGGRYPYELLKAKLIDNGNVVFSGLAKLTSFQAGWNVLLLGAEKGLFDQLSDLKLRSLDLSQYDHLWDLAHISSFAGATSGVVYPVIDYGSFDSDTFASDALFPSVYAHTLIRKMLQQIGYRPAGDWLEDDLIKRIALPFVDDDPQSRDQSWIDDRTARVTVTRLIAFQNTVDVIIPFTVDDQGDYFFDGKLNNFKPTLNAYKPDVAMRLRVQASQPFKVVIGFGAVEAKLIVVKNGINVAEEYFSVSGPYNLTETKEEVLLLDEYVNCRAGDQIQIRFVFQKRTLLSDYSVFLYFLPESTWASFTPDATVRPGDTWPVARNLPDLTSLDLLKTIALMTSSTYQVDDLRKTVTLVRLDSVIAETSQAVDWSTRVEESEEPQLSITLDPYGQKNNLKWKTFDKISPYGDGVVTSQAANLPTSANLFDLPFAACLDSTHSLTTYGPPVLIQTRTLNSDKTLTKAGTDPRLILIEPSKTIAVKANVLTPENIVRNEPVTLTACWWGQRNNYCQLPANSFTLAFDRVAITQREQTLILRYFSGLKRILRRPRLLAVSMMLEPSDIETLDLTLPIRLRKVRAGALQLNDGFYYLNKIQNYSSAIPCTVVLIPYF